MLRKDVIEYFGGTPASAAKALGITEAAISQWGEIVPEGRAYKIESMTKRRLRVNPSLYPRRSKHSARDQATAS